MTWKVRVAQTLLNLNIFLWDINTKVIVMSWQLTILSSARKHWDLVRGFIRSRESATSQVIAAYYFDKLHRFSQFSKEACPPVPGREKSPYGSFLVTASYFPKPAAFNKTYWNPCLVERRSLWRYKGERTKCVQWQIGYVKEQSVFRRKKTDWQPLWSGGHRPIWERQ